MIYLQLCGRSFLRQNKNVLDRPTRSVKDESITIRVATLIHSLKLCTLRDTSIPPATDVCPHVAEYSGLPFDCALRGPFDGLFSARLSASRTLCKSIAAVISASTVFLIIVYLSANVNSLFMEDRFFFPAYPFRVFLT